MLRNLIKLKKKTLYYGHLSHELEYVGSLYAIFLSSPSRYRNKWDCAPARDKQTSHKPLSGHFCDWLAGSRDFSSSFSETQRRSPERNASCAIGTVRVLCTWWPLLCLVFVLVVFVWILFSLKKIFFLNIVFTFTFHIHFFTSCFS